MAAASGGEQETGPLRSERGDRHRGLVARAKGAGEAARELAAA